MMRKYRGLMETYLTGKKAAAQLMYPQDSSFGVTEASKRASEADSKWIEAMALEEPIAADLMELRRQEARHRNLVHFIRLQYTALAADPRIKAALRALNKGRQPKLALGPVADYRKNLLRQSNELLGDVGLRREGDVYWLAEEAELIRQVSLASRLWREIAEDEPRPPRPGQAASAPGMSPPVAPRPGPARPTVAVAPATREARPATPPARKPSTAAELAAKRALFVRLVSELRRRADALQERREVLLAEGEARDAMDEINRNNQQDATGLPRVQSEAETGPSVPGRDGGGGPGRVIPPTRDGEPQKVVVRA